MPINSNLYQEREQLPALVLVHGLGSAGNIWKTLISRLQGSFSVYTLDLPGHGSAALAANEELDPKSLAAKIASHLESEYGVTQFHLAGNSLGGWITLELAAIYPERVLSVTALAPAGLWEGGPTSRYPPTIVARLLAKISQYFLRIAYRTPFLKAAGYKKITHLWRELSFETCRDSVIAMASATGFKPMWQQLRNKNFSGEISQKVPVSVVFGDYDLTLPNPEAQLRSKAPSHTNWIVVENCAHVIMWNYPELTVDFIKDTAFKY
jgi:pimeloyl-ACP methyl ester carboxylesterase